MAAKTSHHKQYRVLSNFIAIIRTRQIRANSHGFDFLRTLSKFSERKKCNVIRIISVRPPENVKISIFMLYSSTVSGESTKKRDARAKLLVCKSNLLHFWRSRSRCYCDMLNSLLSKLFITQCASKSSFDNCRIYMKEESLPHLSQQ